MASGKMEVIVKLEDLDQVRDYILKLVETLQWYANPDNYVYVDHDYATRVEEDRGQRARDVLKERL